MHHNWKKQRRNNCHCEEGELVQVVAEARHLGLPLTAGEKVGQVVLGAEQRPYVEEVDSGGTHGEEGYVHPGSDL